MARSDISKDLAEVLTDNEQVIDETVRNLLCVARDTSKTLAYKAIRGELLDDKRMLHEYHQLGKTLRDLAAIHRHGEDNGELVRLFNRYLTMPRKALKAEAKRLVDGSAERKV